MTSPALNAHVARNEAAKAERADRAVARYLAHLERNNDAAIAAAAKRAARAKAGRKTQRLHNLRLQGDACGRAADRLDAHLQANACRHIDAIMANAANDDELVALPLAV